ncbi:MAG: cyclic nucleotide-binding domain-containing protein [Acidobacteriota bacterium]|nr:MAG: cyclic nucleotide-binding domain-containing protein [Acidobacteriota bacterium]
MAHLLRGRIEEHAANTEKGSDDASRIDLRAALIVARELENEGRMLHALSVLLELDRVFPNLEPIRSSLLGVARSAQTPLFAGFSADDIRAVLEATEVEHLVTGELVRHNKRSGDVLLIVVDGELAVTDHGSNGPSFEVRRLGGGECFGRLSLDDGEASSLQAIATRRTVVLSLRRGPLLKAAGERSSVWSLIDRFQREGDTLPTKDPAGVLVI